MREGSLRGGSRLRAPAGGLAAVPACGRQVSVRPRAAAARRLRSRTPPHRGLGGAGSDPGCSGLAAALQLRPQMAASPHSGVLNSGGAHSAWGGGVPPFPPQGLDPNVRLPLTSPTRPAVRSTCRKSVARPRAGLLRMRPVPVIASPDSSGGPQHPFLPSPTQLDVATPGCPMCFARRAQRCLANSQQARPGHAL